MVLLQYIQKSFGFYTKQSNESYEYVENKIDWSYAFIVSYVLGLIASIITLSIDSILNPNYQAIFGVATIPITLIFTAILIPIFVFISYGIIYGFFKLVGGEAGFLDTMKFGMAISLLPALINIVLNPLSYLKYVIKSPTLLIAIAVIMIIVGLALFVFILMVSIKTFSKLHNLTTLRTIVALIALPLVVILLIGIMITILYSIL